MYSCQLLVYIHIYYIVFFCIPVYLYSFMDLVIGCIVQSRMKLPATLSSLCSKLHVLCSTTNGGNMCSLPTLISQNLFVFKPS